MLFLDSKWIRNSRAARIGAPLIKPRSKSKSQPVSPNRESLPPWNWIVRDIDIGDTKSDCGGYNIYTNEIFGKMSTFLRGLRFSIDP